MSAGPVVVVAAESFEFAGWLKRIPHKPCKGLPVRFAHVGQSRNTEFIFVADGPGFERAGHATREALKLVHPVSIWSVGLCGGLDKSLRAGDIVIASEVIDALTGDRWNTEASAIGSAPTARGGAIVSQDRIAATAEEKERLRPLGDAVEMEASAVAREASRRGVGFRCFKVVADTAEEGFGVDLNAARGEDGRFQTARIVSSAFGRPTTRLPELLGLYRRSRFAARTLGDFLVRQTY
jgi:nucleoside phosphorylase